MDKRLAEHQLLKKTNDGRNGSGVSSLGAAGATPELDLRTY
jgi:hypothetical protein